MGLNFRPKQNFFLEYCSKSSKTSSISRVLDSYLRFRDDLVQNDFFDQLLIFLCIIHSCQLDLFCLFRVYFSLENILLS